MLSFQKLYLKLVLLIFGKKKIASKDAAEIAVEILSPAVRTGVQPLPNIVNLPPSTLARLDEESSAAHLFLFTHLFRQSCGDDEFATQTLAHYGSRIAYLLTKDQESYERIVRLYEARGSEYQRILANARDGNYEAFAKAYCHFLDIPDHADQSCEAFTEIARTYRSMIARIWETMEIKR